MNFNQLDFATYCIGLISSVLGKSQKDVFNVLNSSGMLMSYIVSGYDVLHTFGREYLADDLISYMTNKGIRI